MPNPYECFSQKGMHFIHINIRSLLASIDEIRLLANKTNASVIAITESWLDHYITDAEILNSGYIVERRDRNRQGRGVCIYIKDSHVFYRRDNLSRDGLETVLTFYYQNPSLYWLGFVTTYLENHNFTMIWKPVS